MGTEHKYNSYVWFGRHLVSSHFCFFFSNCSSMITISSLWKQLQLFDKYNRSKQTRVHVQDVTKHVEHTSRPETHRKMFCLPSSNVLLPEFMHHSPPVDSRESSSLYLLLNEWTNRRRRIIRSLVDRGMISGVCRVGWKARSSFNPGVSTFLTSLTFAKSHRQIRIEHMFTRTFFIVCFSCTIGWRSSVIPCETVPPPENHRSSDRRLATVHATWIFDRNMTANCILEMKCNLLTLGARW